MVSINHGIDICSIKRIYKITNKNLDLFLKKCFSPNEISIIKKLPAKKLSHKIAGIFAAKEAVIKALDYTKSYSALRQIEIANTPNGKPYVKLMDNILEHYLKINQPKLEISISHDCDYAIGSAIAIYE